MKHLRTPLVLAAILATLGGVAYWDEIASKKEEDQKKSQNKVFSGTWEPKVIRFQSHTDKTVTDVTLEKSDAGSWVITSPITTKADTYETAKLWETIRDYQFEKEITDSKERWAEFGLAEPKTTIELKNGDQTFSFYLGDKAPLGYSVYVRTSSSNKVMIGSQFVVMPFSKKLFDLRAKSIAEIPADTLAKLSYEAPSGPALNFEKKEGTWTLLGRTEQKVNPDSLLDFIATLNRENAVEFVDTPSADLQNALGRPVLPSKVIAKVRWELTSGGTGSLTFVENDEAVLAYEKLDLRVAKLRKEFGAKLVKTADDFLANGGQESHDSAGPKASEAIPPQPETKHM